MKVTLALVGHMAMPYMAAASESNIRMIVSQPQGILECDILHPLIIKPAHPPGRIVFWISGAALLLAMHVAMSVTNDHD